MMKGHKKMKLKKLLAAALTLAMVFTLTLPAFAAGSGSGSITISKPAGNAVSIAGQTFKVYRIFDLTMSDTEHPETSAYSYTTADNFEDFETFYSGELGGKTLPAYVAAFDETDDAEDLKAFATAVWAWIYNSGGSANAPPDGSVTVPSDTEEVTIDNLDLGYYLVYGAGTNAVYSQTAVSLTSADPNAEITLKTDAPTLDKDVSDDTNGDFGDYTDLNIGDTAYFKLTTAVPDMNGYTDYTFTIHDTLSAGLTFNGTTGSGAGVGEGVKVTLNGEDDYVNYTLDVTGQVITIDFTGLPDNFDDYDVGAEIVITYSATLNADAEIQELGGSGDDNTNTVYLEYSNNPYAETTGKTIPDIVKVYTFKFDIFKYYLTDEDDKEANRTELAGAEFELHIDTAEGTAVNFFFDDDTYRPAFGTDTPTTYKLISDTNGKIMIEGLDSGTYYLVETKAPHGYNPLTGPIKVEIAPDIDDGPSVGYVIKVGDAGDTVTDEDEADPQPSTTVRVLNNTGIELPESGGIGRTIFTVVGLLLMFGACVVLIARRKTAER
jgi:fimbrial isopeptide formation D2 family protein/LPXTG-motif cell wall-anchored protein